MPIIVIVTYCLELNIRNHVDFLIILQTTLLCVVHKSKLNINGEF